LAGAGVSRFFRRKELESPDDGARENDTAAATSALVPWEADQANKAQQPSSVGSRTAGLQQRCQLSHPRQEQQNNMWRTLATTSSSSTSAASTASMSSSMGAVDICQSTDGSIRALGIQAPDRSVLQRAQGAGSYSWQAYQQKCAELGVMKRDLDCLHATLQGSCRMLQENSWMQPGEAQRHVNGLVSIGRRFHLQDSLLQMLPMLALKTSNAWSSDDLAVLKSLEAALEAQIQSLEERLTQHLAVVFDMRQHFQQASLIAALYRGKGTPRSRKRANPSPVASCPEALQTTSTVDCSALHLLSGCTSDSEALQWQSKKRRHDQVYPCPASKAAMIITDGSMELPTTFVPFWEVETENQQMSVLDGKRRNGSEKKQLEALPVHMPETKFPKQNEPAGANKSSSKPERIPKDLESTATVLLLVIREGDAEALASIKGLKEQDIEKILAARQRNGPLDSLDRFPELMGRRLSVIKLLRDNIG